MRHKNASMTPKGRRHLMREIDRIGFERAAAAAVCAARKWRERYEAEWLASLIAARDRSVPHDAST